MILLLLLAKVWNYSTPSSDIAIVACEGMETKDLSFVGSSKIWKIIV